ncbi:hypothetical protein EVB32_236 [Rhizobium phage RHph_TM39]|uniref:Uncharacterized protein n=1 Tax=Rhizobium phage RHph_TM30 TaxID=2509764 RepID=A0A7S5REX1_9CAUD|nr:hypothetical protein PQC16_gp252 [Rhizobium phage RHph_TM30]QIG71723.1 hypothetical protein EVB94_252 [Rhizobium phage RHph_TM40]QIG72086.1 hypothetical protein EVB95_252 [Rhizobium phage RHph_TM2_3B]QIG72448.1 hypothetical protein EVB96_252 [Rhizobium phage RHph_TM3_3_6]QIG77224.1 hypothetical protein EVB32_236 [Rhizobium phage RHph_TM39]QIG77838.1 hypothetical protein EVB64_251 [Rhizobium phage RHph_TM61]
MAEYSSTVTAYDSAGSEKLFNIFKDLKMDLDMLSAIVQNPMKIKHTELLRFKKDMDIFCLKFVILKDETMDFVMSQPPSDP